MEKNPLLSKIKSSQQIDLLMLKKQYNLESLIAFLNDFDDKSLDDLAHNESYLNNFLDLFTFIYSLSHIRSSYSESTAKAPTPKIKKQISRKVFNMFL